MNYYYVYILANDNNSTIYIGMTNDLVRRVKEHKSFLIDGFTKKYKIHKLVYYEKCLDVNSAIKREKQLKKWSRAKKETLINHVNSDWKDISAEV